jgi:uridylate kinase
MLQTKGLKTRVLSAIQMPEVAELMIISNALEYLRANEIVIFGGGTGNPFFSTDSGAALRAVEIKADALLKATKVDGVYDRDPEKFTDAKMFSTLDYQTAIAQQLKVMDLTAFSLCMENQIPIVVYNMKHPGNLKKVLTGARIGTTISRRTQ